MSDRDTIHAAQRGDARALESLVLRHQRRVHGIVRAHGVPVSAIDDVVQDSFLAAIRNLDRLRDSRRFGPWLLAIARNTALRFHRSSRTNDTTRPASPVQCPPDSLEATELRDRLWHHVENLSPAVREAIFLYYYEGRSVREAALALEISRAAVKKRLQEGRDALRGRLWKELEEELRDRLPSVRDWRRKARPLALLAVASLPARATAAGSHSSVGATSSTSGTGAALLTSTFIGVAMTSKKIVVVTAVALLAVLTLGPLWVFRSPDEPTDELDRVGRAVFPDTPTGSSAEAAWQVASRTPDPIGSDGATRVKAPLIIAEVVDSDGEPVPDAVVEARWGPQRIVAKNGRAEIVQHKLQLVESSPGEFPLIQRHGSRVLLVVDAPLYKATSRTIDVPENSARQRVRFELEYVGILEFRLVAPDEGDRPVVGAAVGYIKNRPEILGGPLGFPPTDYDARGVVPRIDEVTSDTDGNFSVGYKAGTLWITAEGLAPTAVRIDSTAQSFDRQSIPMHPPTTLRIEVDRADGAQILDFRYGLARDTRELYGNFGRKIQGRRVEHDLYHHCVLQPHPYIVDRVGVGVSSGDLEARRSVPLMLGALNKVRVVLDPNHTRITGRVLSDSGVAIEGARILAASGEQRQTIRGDRISGSTPSTRSSEDGSYELVLSAETRSVNLVVNETEYPLHISERLVLQKGGSVGHDIVLPRPATLRVRLAQRVRDRASEELSLTNESMDCFPMLEYRRGAAFGDDGIAVIEQVNPGPWVLEWIEDSMIRRLPITATAGQTHEIVLGEIADGIPRVRAAGRLISRTRSVDGVTLWLKDRERSELLAKATTDSDGAFVFQDVPVGHHTVAIAIGQRLPDLPLRYVGVDVDPAGTPIVIDVTTSTLRGYVRSASGPLAGVRVRPHARHWIRGVERWAGFVSAETDTTGQFVLKGVYQAPTTLSFEKEGYAPVRVRWTSHESSNLDDVVLQKSGNNSGISFRVLDAESRVPLQSGSIQVSAIEEDLELPVTRIPLSESESSFNSGPLPPGEYRATLLAGEWGVLQYGMKQVDVAYDGTSQNVDVLCARGASVFLILDSSNGQVPTHATVETRDLEGTVLPAWNGQSNLVFSGTALLAGLPLQGVTVRVSASGWKTAKFRIQPVPGRVARVVRRLEREYASR